jgi:hypothetical protein
LLQFAPPQLPKTQFKFPLASDHTHAQELGPCEKDKKGRIKTKNTLIKYTTNK